MNQHIQSVLLLNAVIGLLLPLINQIVVRVKAPTSFKVYANLVLSAVAGAATPYLVSDSVPWKVLGLSIVQVFATSVVTHENLWKPLAVTGESGAIANAVPGGVGPEEVPPVPEVVPEPVQVIDGPPVPEVQLPEDPTGVPDSAS